MVCGPWGRKESDTTEATEHTHGGEREVVCHCDFYLYFSDC